MSWKSLKCRVCPLFLSSIIDTIAFRSARVPRDVEVTAMFPTSRLTLPEKGAATMQERVSRDRWEAAEEKPGTAEALGESLPSASAQRSRAQKRPAETEGYLKQPSTVLQPSVHQLMETLVVTDEHESSLQMTKEQHLQQLEEAKRARESAESVPACQTLNTSALSCTKHSETTSQFYLSGVLITSKGCSKAWKR